MSLHNIPDSNPAETQGARWVYFDSTKGAWGFYAGREDKQKTFAPLIKGILGYITRAWLDANPAEDIPARWELRVNLTDATAVVDGQNVPLGETELRISTPVPLYLLVERLMVVHEGRVFSISGRRLPDAKTAFVDVHLYNGRQWEVVRNDEVPTRLQGDRFQKYDEAIALIQRHPAWISEHGEPAGKVPATNPGDDVQPHGAAPLSPVQASAPDQPTRQQQNEAEKEAQRPLDAPVFWNVQLPKAQKVENWDTPATPAQATALRTAVATKLGRTASDGDFIFALERVCSDMRQGYDKKESRAAVGYLYDFTNTANAEQFKAFWDAATYDPFADE